jgi:cobalt-zinc-cadmium efflux system outer membrane protein
MRASNLLQSTLAAAQILLLWPLNAVAEEPHASAQVLLAAPSMLTKWLDDHQPGMSILSSRGREAAAATRDAGLIPNPVVTVGAAGLTFGHRNPSSLSFTDTPSVQVTLAETVEIGKRSHRIKAAQYHAEAVEQDSAYTRGLMVADARESLAKIVYLGALRQALEERLKSVRGIVDLDEVRLQHGDVSGIDHRRLELEVLNVERELSDNASDLTEAQAQCMSILGTPCDGDVNVSVLESSLVHPTAPVGLVFEPAQRPDVKAQRAEAEAATEQVKLFENRKIPDPQIGVSYLYDRLTYAGNQPHTFGVFVSMPLPVSDYGQHQRTQAQERAKQAEFEAKRLELVAKSEAKNLFASEEVTNKKLELLRTQALPLGTTVLEATESAYRLGQVSLTDLLLARRQQAELQLDLVETYYSLFQIRSQIHRVLGLDAREQKSQ